MAAAAYLILLPAIFSCFFFALPFHLQQTQRSQSLDS
ncbi:hypothetical protein CCACVL1_03437 [Corchorus capsularis]|uniref:Uncharacterized protein n=1 Tax=Corchorus capsularis TaxID=210143 RepID=A0A1R3JZG9_COCAP|nr:hypothetical protein CCACVL1_03437 [Corchorus capsularis]